MIVNIAHTPVELGRAAAARVAAALHEAVVRQGQARLLVSTGSSQFETLAALIGHAIDWPKIEVFHLDEYVGLPMEHPASFRKYLYERFIRHIPVKAFYPVSGEGDVEENIRQLSARIQEMPIDVALIGIGENGHIAFNDPPADFETEVPYLVVTLDEKCKMQQVNEGWFPSLEAVPVKAISMSARQIMKSKIIVSAVPHSVKADAVAKTLSGEVSPLVPATLLKQHPDWLLCLDAHSAAGVIKI
ncbi:MAG: 6-phosphogluconolactonase [Marinilabiliales bacterium]|nr:6-phosphogluconolactonase [Marinilabiliales bacterium]